MKDQSTIFRNRLCRWIMLIGAVYIGDVHMVRAQQLLNLDFEKLSSEGMSRPWGWLVEHYAYPTEATCDSIQVFSGDFSLKISSGLSPDSSHFRYAFFVEPCQILSRTLSLSGYARGPNFDGKIKVQLECVGTVSDSFGTVALQETVLPYTDHWLPFSVSSLLIPPQTHSIFVTIDCQGVGNYWLDNLRLKIDDSVVTSVPIAPQISEQQIATLQAETIPFDHVKPQTQRDEITIPTQDLYFLKPFIKNAKIIGLGESTHGTSEFFTLKHRMLQFAIRELGVRVFILEDNQRLVGRINDFVLDGVGTAEEVIKGLFAVWNTEEMLALIKWLRSYNLSHGDQPVEFLGMDAQNPALAIEHLHEFLSKHDKTIQRESDQLLDPIRQNWRQSFQQSDDTKQDWDDRAQKNLNLISSKFTQWMRQAVRRADSLEVRWALQDARVIKQFTEIQYTNVFEGRDRSMAENIKWLTELYDDSTTFLVWAHDSHIAKGNAVIPEDNYFLGKSMGSYLSDWFGKEYVAYGLFTHAGTCLGTISYSNFTQAPFEIYPAPIGSLEKVLHRISQKNNTPNLFLNLNSPQILRADWMMTKRPARYVGYVAEDYGFGGRYVLPKQFDGILFIDHSTAATPIRD